MGNTPYKEVSLDVVAKIIQYRNDYVVLRPFDIKIRYIVVYVSKIKNKFIITVSGLDPDIKNETLSWVNKLLSEDNTKSYPSPDYWL